ncbi:ATP-dependent Clp protease proteolytic subunit [Candidatus Nardonella dryophthoridicola]|uniref:ATP-dependent Clp protease proteolytic subunit n=1 Tax=endosymbiont of Rhynchophorus ferrugineus TaxID=1972133 RepID=A0A2Z5T3N8_9GAMM|nr:ATP-dependent Clp protease proteolytic subunit [Candidatus Nardonella dryophthoridicola]BBA85008.1 ATP-dependent Clp protease proteolytic subunit [endosymbiont of Rhynchophorus ferrugineus]
MNSYNLNNNINTFYDIYIKLLKNRIIFLYGIINDRLSSNIISQLLFLESENNKKDISIYINSPGGIITSGLSIYDTMMIVKPDIKTICLGQACSMASLILSAGKKGKRFCLPNSKIMIHQPLGGYYGQASDIEIHTKEILKIKIKMNELLSKHTGKSIDEIEKDSDRDYFFDSEEAIKYGLIDSIIEYKDK